MASKSKYGPSPQPVTYPNKPGGGGGKGASFAGKHARAASHVQAGMSLASSLAKKNRGQ